MLRVGRGTSTSGRGHITVPTGAGKAITFLYSSDYHRYIKGSPPRNYVPNVGQTRYTREEMRELLMVLQGGKSP